MSLEEVKGTRYFHIMEGVGINSETTICQYLDLEYLMKILNEDAYYVKRKKFFDDDREKDYPNYLHFVPVPMSEFRSDWLPGERDRKRSRPCQSRHPV